MAKKDLELGLDDGTGVDYFGVPVKVGDVIICTKGAQQNTSFYEREVLIVSDKEVKLKGFPNWRSGHEILSMTPHREVCPEYFI